MGHTNRSAECKLFLNLVKEFCDTNVRIMHHARRINHSSCNSKWPNYINIDRRISALSSIAFLAVPTCNL